MSERRSSPAATPAYRRPFSRGRLVLSAFAMLACACIAFVTVTDPYAGQTAEAATALNATGARSDYQVQRFPIQGGYVLVAVTRDKFKAVKPAPVIVVHDTTSAASSGGGDASAGMGYTTPVGTAQTYAAQLVASNGWGAGEFSCLVNLWNRESGWNTHAYNPSGAYGIPQALPGSKMAAFGSDWQNDYRVQIQWGLSYIRGSYGSPCGAWAHSNAYNWY
ncbi:MAG: lytic transglycosylase domain-containing protein [Amnibacterium sp.]